MRYVLAAILALLVLVAPVVSAAPGTYTVTVTGLSADGGGPADGWRLFQGCDLTAQTVGAVVADPVVVGGVYSFAGNTDSPPVLCARPFNSAGQGGFANVVTLVDSQIPPGTGTLNLTCEVVLDTGEIRNCQGQVQ